MVKILTADDSVSMRQMVTLTLKEAGYDVKACCDGQEALIAAKLKAYDVVLSDVNMPEMNGIQLVMELRKLPNYKFTPILMLTTESGAAKKNEGKKAGATGWIVKPFEPTTLINTIKKVLN
ncbi:response regulator [Spartinivicinus poritis]|uniref:Response regulator n=1 Tax=Spartinivicinus poritis TaxID=2994640 RepID=A0ABT5U986_9GAMM|nr:response regulator [Spartinivicinus sp. A2-2]MDE1462925.1 response regulator [Spartinivicinus sp. A2-2]